MTSNTFQKNLYGNKRAQIIKQQLIERTRFDSTFKIYLSNAAFTLRMYFIEMKSAINHIL